MLEALPNWILAPSTNTGIALGGTESPIGTIPPADGGTPAACGSGAGAPTGGVAVSCGGTAAAAGFFAVSCATGFFAVSCGSAAAAAVFTWKADSMRQYAAPSPGRSTLG